jgi:hypothetical protein
VLAAAEPLFLGGGDHTAVDHEGRGRVVEEGVDSQEAHAASLPRVKRF